jgi:hypothetical protein
VTARNSENFCNKLRRAISVLATRIDPLARSMFGLFAIVKQIINAGDNFSTRETQADRAAQALTVKKSHLSVSKQRAQKRAHRTLLIARCPEVRF